MSRGFVKEDDQEEVPMVPQRAVLPAGVTNFVTPEGMNLLLAEREVLISERNDLNISNENEKRIAQNFINAKLQLLNNRIAEARVVNPAGQPEDEIRFGAIVTLRIKPKGKIQTFQIVGVDEADISKGKVAFTSPFARVMINKKTGDTAVLKQSGKDIEFEILKISYLK